MLRLFGGVAEEEGGMVGDGYLCVSARVPGAAERAEGLCDSEEVGGGGAAEGDDDFGADEERPLVVCTNVPLIA